MFDINNYFETSSQVINKLKDHKEQVYSIAQVQLMVILHSIQIIMEQMVKDFALHQGVMLELMLLQLVVLHYKLALQTLQLV